MKDNGKMIYNMATELKRNFFLFFILANNFSIDIIAGPIKANMKEIMNMVKNKEKEFILGQMGNFIFLFINFY